MSSSAPISTAGAVQVLNPKGEVSMQKVKVQRYVSGRRPEYADRSSDELDSEDEFITEKVLRKEAKIVEVVTVQPQPVINVPEEVVRSDKRLQRLRRRNEEATREIAEPEVLSVNPEQDMDRRRPKREVESEESEEEYEEESVERRHALLRMKRELEEEELLGLEEDQESVEEEEEEDESEYEEYSDSEEDTCPRLKPVFVRKRDRVTIHEKEKMELKMRESEVIDKRAADERRKIALKIIEDERKRELAEKKDDEITDEMIRISIAAIDTDDENEETSYESWKLRELKRVKRTKDEREAREKEKDDIERMHNMTEEERQEELKKNPKVITNAAPKGKYRFLQKYYHRGAFFLDEEDQVFKRDIAQPTLEDHFDKTILPKVMQVKNFGRSGRTKYTHLVDQDTTAFDSPWVGENNQSTKFLNTQAGGMKQNFERPTKRRK